MRILHFSTNDVTGGAALAAYRLHGALRAAGHESEMIVRNKRSDDPTVRQAPRRYLRSSLRRLRQLLPTDRPTPKHMFNFDSRPEVDERAFLAHRRGEVDVICLHWITQLLTVQGIRRLYEHYRCPIVWTLVDQEPVTGGCHYSFGCPGYTAECGSCPQLDSTDPNDLSHVIWTRKRRLLDGVPLTFVAPTWQTEVWLENSSLFASHPRARIPLAIDPTVFHPGDREAARRALGVPEGKLAVFAGATSLSDPRKGMEYLVEALQRLHSLLSQGAGPSPDDVVLLLAGREEPAALGSLPFTRRHVGFAAGDEALARLYRAADVFVCPSVEDAGPMMIPEAMLCGTPVVAFDCGGAPDLVEPMVTGYRAVLRDGADLALGIRAVLAAEHPERMRAACREAAVAAHAADAVARRHAELYRTLTAPTDGLRSTA